MPWDTMALSVVLFVVVPLVAGYFTRKTLIARKGLRWFEQSFLPKFGPVTIVALLATLVTIFILQGEIIVNNTLHILLIVIPLTTQTAPPTRLQDLLRLAYFGLLGHTFRAFAREALLRPDVADALHR